MTNTPSRVPFARVQPNSVDDPKTQRALGLVDQNFQRLERFTQGQFQPRVITAALSPYQVQSTDGLLLCDCTSGAVTLVYPAAARIDGYQGMAVKTDASANAVTLSGTFNGVVNPTLAAQYQSKTINAGNGAYYFVPTISPADIPSGTFPGNYVIAGTLEVDGNFTVNTNKFTVIAASGNTTVAGTLGVTGNVTVNTNKFVVTASSGNTSIAGTLTVGGKSIFNATASGIVADFQSDNTTSGMIRLTTNAGGSGIKGYVYWDATGYGLLNNTGNFFLYSGAGSSPSLIVPNGLSVASDVAVNTSKFTITASSGNFASAGNASIGGVLSTGDAQQHLGVFGTGSDVGGQSSVLLSTTIDNSGGSGVNAHGISNYSTITRGGSIGYAAFDSRTTISGTSAFSHLCAYQGSGTYSSSNTIDDLFGFLSSFAVTAGTATRMKHFYVQASSFTGSVGTQWGLYIDSLTGATTNIGISTANQIELRSGAQIVMTGASSTGATSTDILLMTNAGNIKGQVTTTQRQIIGFNGGSTLLINNDGLNTQVGGTLVIGTASLATNATDGFLYIPSCAGTPTGTPTAFTGRIPLVYDSSNNFLYIYNGVSWKKSTVYA